MGTVLEARGWVERVGSLAGVPAAQLAQLMSAMATVQRLVAPSSTDRPRIYARECGWSQAFEALVADIAARLVREFQPERERCWIAEPNGEPAGSC